MAQSPLRPGSVSAIVPIRLGNEQAADHAIGVFMANGGQGQIGKARRGFALFVRDVPRHIGGRTIGKWVLVFLGVSAGQRTQHGRHLNDVFLPEGSAVGQFKGGMITVGHFAITPIDHHFVVPELLWRVISSIFQAIIKRLVSLLQCLQ